MTKDHAGGVPLDPTTLPSDTLDWKKEFDEKMGAYTDGRSEIYIKGERAGTKGFWLRSGMDGDIDTEAVKDFMEQLLASQVAAARIQCLEWCKGTLEVNSHNDTVKFIDMQLDGLKEGRE